MWTAKWRFCSSTQLKSQTNFVVDGYSKFEVNDFAPISFCANPVLYKNELIKV
jgi:hypothetical protein